MVFMSSDFALGINVSDFCSFAAIDLLVIFVYIVWINKLHFVSSRLISSRLVSSRLVSYRIVSSHIILNLLRCRMMKVIFSLLLVLPSSLKFLVIFVEFIKLLRD